MRKNKDDILILLKKPADGCELRRVKNKLSAFQELVGGYIETVHMFDNVLLVCNEDGKLHGLAPNFPIPGDYIVGTAFFCATDGEEFQSLTGPQIRRLLALFEPGDAESGMPGA